MSLTCPKCSAIVPPAEINVGTDVAMCRACGTMHKASELVHDEVVDQQHEEASNVLSGPQPAGVVWRDDGQTLTVRAKIGSTVLGGFFAIFATFWTFPTLFVALDAVDELLAGPTTPAPIAEDATEFERAHQEMMTAHQGADIADWIMAFVLVCVSGLFWSLALTALRAKVRITVRPDQGIVKKGAFPFTITRQFDPARVAAVVETVDTGTRINGKNPTKIVIKADEEISFGGFMPEGRRKWVAALLQANLVRRR